MFTLVLHSHLPWLANHGRWPVGEEWLYQSWAASYLPVTRVLRDLAAEGRTGLVSLGITPVLAAQLDDPHCLAGMHHWLGNWQLRAHEAALRPNQALRELGAREHRAASAAIADFELRWRHGGSPALRELIDADAVELLGGPLAHPFQPLLHPRLREFSLVEGLADAHDRWGATPPGIWAPECGFTPGMEQGYAAAGVRHFLVDGPALRGDTALGRPVRDSDVVAFGRDLQVSYRVWSPKSGYPGHGSYRDFHTYDHRTGLKPSRVTGRTVASADKAPYDPDLAAVAVRRDAADFVATVRDRLRDESARIGRPAHVIAAFDTVLFGHWWHEGPQWLDAVLRALPDAGVRVGTLAQAHAEGYVGDPFELSDSSWGSGKDWRVWSGEQVADFVDLNDDVARTALDTIDKARAANRADWRDVRSGVELRDATNDQLLREALLTVASDWAFMVSKDSAAGYARDRAHLHAHATREIADAVSAGHRDRARRLAEGWRDADNLFPRLDARRLAGDDRSRGRT
ncbi:MAG TPA: glycoside hydrolase family 57 protein [Aldersonia sp.]